MNDTGAGMDKNDFSNGKAFYIICGILSAVVFYSLIPAFSFITESPGPGIRIAYYAIISLITVISFIWFFIHSGGSSFFAIPYFAVCVLFSVILFAFAVSDTLTDGVFVLSFVNGILLIVQMVSETRKYLGSVRRDDTDNQDK